MVRSALGEVLQESGDKQTHIYFPTTAIVSLLYVTESSASAEIAFAGDEGAVGIPLFMGGGTTPSRAIVQSKGQGFRLSARMIKEEFRAAASRCSTAKAWRIAPATATQW